jgi:hypothetical protein
MFSKGTSISLPVRNPRGNKHNLLILQLNKHHQKQIVFFGFVFLLFENMPSNKAFGCIKSIFVTFFVNPLSVPQKYTICFDLRGLRGKRGGFYSPPLWCGDMEVPFNISLNFSQNLFYVNSAISVF